VKKTKEIMNGVALPLPLPAINNLPPITNSSLSKLRKNVSSASNVSSTSNVSSEDDETSYEEEDGDDRDDEDDEDDEDEKNDLEEQENSKVISDKKIDTNASFFATFIDGSSLRYLIEYLRLTSTDGTFVFTKDTISYQKGDDDKTIFNDLKLKTYHLTEYEFSSFNTEIPATVNLSELRNKTRTVGKKEQLDIYRRPEEPSNFYVQVRSQEKGSGDNPVFYCMAMKNENVTIYKLPEYTRDKHNPNCTIYQSDFSKVCKALIANKCSYVEFIGYDRGIIIKGYAPDGKVAMVKEYGKCRALPTSRTSASKSVVNTNDKNTIKPQVAAPRLSVRDANEVERFRVHISNIKALAKINGFSPNGTIKFYIEHDLPMKLTVGVGSFGKLSILIKTA
jgi:hypothetical protein